MLHLNPNRLPRHVAIIMDGNGRWAKARLRKRVFGHEEGANSVREVVRSCLELGIPYLTLYAFSKENWKRPPAEVKALWELLKRFIHAELSNLVEKEIRLIHMGDVEGIPDDVLRELNRAVDSTRRFRKLTVTLAINYGGRQEITRAAKRFAADVQRGKAEISSLTPESFSRYLFTTHLPELDFLIRTGGESRISNFLLWQLAYTEIYFTKVLWPDFREAQFSEALQDYQRRERRFGMTGDQVREELDEEQVADALR
ncbi:MAG: isoprenyl transferase [Syntrophobacteraceae bacterium]|nr:isoprenyl transferase [Syntrophobacteraceae bacterium]